MSRPLSGGDIKMNSCFVASTNKKNSFKFDHYTQSLVENLIIIIMHVVLKNNSYKKICLEMLSANVIPINTHVHSKYKTVFPEKFQMINFEILLSIVIEIQIINRFSIIIDDRKTPLQYSEVKKDFLVFFPFIFNCYRNILTALLLIN